MAITFGGFCGETIESSVDTSPLWDAQQSDSHIMRFEKIQQILGKT
jgi:hypothetical protein